MDERRSEYPDAKHYKLTRYGTGCFIARYGTHMATVGVKGLTG